MPLGMSLWFFLFFVIALLCLAAVYFLVRLRAKAYRSGAFECAYRRDVSAGWTAGVANYTQGRLEWYRLVSFRWGADRSWDREALKVRSTTPRGTETESAITELHCDYRGSRFILAMHRSDYNALISWLEGCPPRSEVFF